MITLPTPEEMMAWFKELKMRPVRRNLGDDDSCCILGLLVCKAAGKQLSFLERCKAVQNMPLSLTTHIIDGWDNCCVYSPLALQAARLALVAFVQEVPT